jgi:CHAT domain-containing protein/tetratricopeptide (TPR) repeat protein
MSQLQTLELTCPHCHREFSASLWTVVNVDTEPHLKTELLEGRLNVAKCPFCGHSSLVQMPFVYHESAVEQVICYVPEEIYRNIGELEGAVQPLVMALLQELGAEELPEYFQTLPLLSNIDVLVAAVQNEQMPIEASDFVDDILQAARQGQSPEELQAALLAQPTPVIGELTNRLEAMRTESSLAVAIQALVETQTSEEVAEVVSSHPILLTEEAVALLRHIAETARQQGEEDTANIFHSRANLLEACRQMALGVMETTEVAMRGTPRDENPIFQLAEQLLNGRITLEEALARVQTPTFISQLSETDIVAFDQFLIGSDENETAQQWALVFALLNSAAAQSLDASPAVNKQCGLTLLGIMLNSSVDIAMLVEACRGVLSFLDQNEEPVLWASVMGELGNALCKMDEGNRAENLELAISCYNQILEVCTQTDFPEQWAGTQHNLGRAYYQRIQGQRAENIEAAISCYTKALEVRTKANFPGEWAETQYYLGTAYLNRIKGSRANNLETAIECFQKSLEVYTQVNSPKEWAATQNELANAYIYRINGQRLDNLEAAINCCPAALRVYTQTANPPEWARTQNDLGAAYLYRIKGDRAENIEVAIDCFQKALEVRTKEDYPEGWADTQSNLVAAYLLRLKDDRSENLEKAINFLQKALEVCTKETRPIAWANFQTNLGIAYSERFKEGRTEYLETAIECCEAALEVYTQDTYPETWADIQNTLGGIYNKMLKGDRAHNLEVAINYYKKALEVYTLDACPEAWAELQQNIGAAYNERLMGVRTDNLKMAQKCLINAIQVFRNLGMWYKAGVASSYLGKLHDEDAQWEEAYFAYRSAIDALEEIRVRALTEEERLRLIRENIWLFERAIVCSMRTSRHIEAAEYTEQGKARNLVDLLNRLSLRPRDVPKEIQQEYEQLLFRAQALERDMRRKGGQTTGETHHKYPVNRIREEFLQTHQEIEKIVARIRTTEPDFLLESLPLKFADMQQLARKMQATIVQLRVTQEGTFAFIITGKEEILSEANVISIPSFSSKTLDQLLVHREGRQRDGWLVWYGDFMVHRNAETRQGWFDCLEKTVEKLYIQLFCPIHQRLKQLGIKKVIFIPNRDLSILPLHAMYYQENGQRRYLLDEFEISYAPSCGVLQRCIARDEEGREKERFAAVANPRRDLSYSDWEIKAILNLFPENLRQTLWHDTAQKKAVQSMVQRSNLIHFSCHGTYNLEDPLQSALLLANEEVLTLSEISESFDARQTWLVTLSACETGLTNNFISPADEYVGLPAGFLYAGAPCVVASLWAVEDRATALLMKRMYENIFKHDMGRAAALRKAQLWLRDLNKEEAKEHLQEMENLTSSTMHARDIVLELHGVSELKDDYPFAHPYYWAAFQCVGAF